LATRQDEANRLKHDLDYGAANIEVASPDVINPVNRPTANVSNKKPGG
jgi:hypothetical protein